MKKPIAAIVMSLVILTGYTVFASSKPGSTEDPLVSKSYVDGQIKSLIGGSYSIVLTDYQLEFIIDQVIEELEYSQGNLNASKQSSQTSYVPVNVEAGDIVLGGEGTEIILRSGTADAYTRGTDGLADITAGTDLTNGDRVSVNHMLIVPREDGRGVSAVSDCWFLIKGDFEIR